MLKLIEEDPRVGYFDPKPDCPPTTKADGDDGWLWPAHRVVFSAIADQATTCILEVGSWYGTGSTQFWTDYSPNALFVAIDLWDNQFSMSDGHYRNHHGLLKKRDLHESFQINTWHKKHKIQQNGLAAGVLPLKMDSVEGIHLCHKMGIVPDVIYIDAGHHYDEAYRDIEACLKCFPEAKICGDDWDYRGVRDAAKDLAKQFNLTLHVEESKCWTYARIPPERLLKSRLKWSSEPDRYKKKKPTLGISSSTSFSEMLKIRAKEKKKAKSKTQTQTLGSDKKKDSDLVSSAARADRFAKPVAKSNEDGEIRKRDRGTFDENENASQKQSQSAQDPKRHRK